MNSPMFPTIQKAKAAAIRVRYGVPEKKEIKLFDEKGEEIPPMFVDPTPPSPHRISITIEMVDYQRIVDSMAEAEQALFEVADSMKRVEDTNPDVISINVLRAGNTIATRTRRGCGNVVLVSRDVAAILEKSFAFKEVEKTTRGNWIEIGLLNNTMTIYTRDDLPEGSLYVIYVADNDGPGYLIDTPEGLGVHIIENNERFLANASDYILRIPLGEEPTIKLAMA